MPFLVEVKGLNRFAGLKFNGLKVLLSPNTKPNTKQQTHYIRDNSANIR
jgi:hypothetical protein